MSSFFDELNAIHPAEDAVTAPVANSFFDELNAIHPADSSTVSVPDIKSSDLSPKDKLQYYNTLHSPYKDMQGTINGIDVNELDPRQKKELGLQILNSQSSDPAENLIRAGASMLLPGGVTQFLPEHTATSQLGAFNNSALRSSLGSLYAFHDELGGVVDTLAQVLAHPSKATSLSNVVDMYAANRDIRRAKQQEDTTQYPISTFLGQLAGTYAPNPMSLTKAAGLIPRLKAAGAAGAFYGALFGAGGSDADLTRNEFLPYLKDTASMMGLGTILALGSEYVLGSLAKGGRKNFLTDQYGPEGAMYTLGTGQGSRGIADKIFELQPFEVKSKAAQAIDAAKAYSIIDLEKYGIRNPSFNDKVNDMSALSRIAKQNWTNFKEFFSKGEPFDYTEARNNLKGVTDTLSENLDDILTRAQAANNQPHDLAQIFGTDFKTALAAKVRNMSLGGDMSKQGAQILDDLNNNIGSGKVNSLSFLRSIRQALGDASAFDSDSVTRFGSQKYAIRGMYSKLNNYIDEQVGSALPDEFKAYKGINKDLSSLAFFDHALEMGDLAKRGVMSQDRGFFEATLGSQGSQAVGALGSASKSLMMGSVSGIGKLISQFGVTPSRVGASMINRPKLAPIILSQIFPSHKEGKLFSKQDKELGSLYIDQNGLLSSRDKALQKYKLNTAGDFDASNIPSSVTDSIQEQDNNV